MRKPKRKTLEQLKKLRKELETSLTAAKKELREIGEGKESTMDVKDLNVYRENLKVRLRGVNAAIRQQGFGKLAIVPPGQDPRRK